MELDIVYDVKIYMDFSEEHFHLQPKLLEVILPNNKEEYIFTLGFCDLSHKLVDLLCSPCLCWCCHLHSHGKHLRHTLALWRSLELLRKFSFIVYFLSVFPCCKPKSHMYLICSHNANIGMHISSHAASKTPP